MYLISAEGYKNASVYCLRIRTTGDIWVSVQDVGAGLGVKSISSLGLGELRVIFEKKLLTKEEIKDYKMTEREMFRKYNLSEDELNIKK